MKRHKWLILTIVVFLTPIIVAFGHFCRQVRRHDAYVRQKAQLHSIDAGIELFRDKCDSYPPSEANDPTGLPYGGAMKLAEALVGQDSLGFHLSSVFRRDGMDATGTSDLYPEDIKAPGPPSQRIEGRMGPAVQWDNARAHRLGDIYGQGRTGPFPEDIFVVCDVFERRRPSGKKTGMPILYYRAHTNRQAHDVNDPDNPQNIYDYRDNHALVALGVPGDPKTAHPFFSDPKRFYKNIQNPQIDTVGTPYRTNTFILISAGWDGQYGTADDVMNFAWKYRQ